LIGSPYGCIGLNADANPTTLKAIDEATMQIKTKAASFVVFHLRRTIKYAVNKYFCFPQQNSTTLQKIAGNNAVDGKNVRKGP